ncbi:hypothetical protein Ocin01_18850 [Orchesella cincta]|uniref:Uncharacterized protein n=1 Tax=Orchesella cincta TaxID=48709 RepID=A0A1D2M4J8_ORCCI|nr:hypothetical protein Ocin01_18850 [Orchesella cincta]
MIGGGRNRANRNRQGLALPAAVEKGTKIKLGGDHGGKELVATLQNDDGISLLRIPLPIKAKTLQNSYEVYLQALLTDLVVQQAQSLQTKISLENLVQKGLESASFVKKKVNRISANQVVIRLSNNLVSMRKLGCIFYEDLETFGFSVEESLLQIMGALSSKFDRIILEGGGESGGSFFLFHELNEMRRLMDQLMRGGSRLDTDSSFRFGFLLKEALKDIRIKIEVAKGNNGKFTQNLKALLESCSLDIMNRLVDEHESIQESASFSGSLQDVSDLGMSLPTLKWNIANQ